MPQPILLCNTKDMPRKQWLECREHGPNEIFPLPWAAAILPRYSGSIPGKRRWNCSWKNGAS